MILKHDDYINSIRKNGNQINSIYVGDESVWGNGGGGAPTPPTPPTPSYEYELLEEIHLEPGNGSAYFNTGYKPIQSTEIEVQYKCMFTSNNAPYNNAFLYSTSDKSSYSASPCIYVCYWRNYLNVKFNGKILANEYKGYLADNTIVHTLLYRNNGFIRYDSLNSSSSGSPFMSNTADLCINAAYKTISPSATTHCGSFYYYYFKIYESTTLVRDYRPARRLLDDAIGFYDMVDNSFLENAGTVPYQYTSKSTPEYI